MRPQGAGGRAPCSEGQPPLPPLAASSTVSFVQVPHAIHEPRKELAKSGNRRTSSTTLDESAGPSHRAPVRNIPQARPCLQRPAAANRRPDPPASCSRAQPGLIDERALGPEAPQTAGRRHVLTGRPLSTVGPNNPATDVVGTDPTRLRVTRFGLSQHWLKLRRGLRRGHLLVNTKMVVTSAERPHRRADGRRGQFEPRTLTRDSLSSPSSRPGGPTRGKV